MRNEGGAEAERGSERIDVAGAPIDICTLEEAVRRIIEHAGAGEAPRYVVTPNAHHVAMLHDSEEFRRIYASAWLSLADGMSIMWAARILGAPLPGKVSGSDLFPALCAASAGTGVRIFLLGGRPGAAEEAARVLRERHPGVEIVGTYCPPMGFDSDPAELEKTDRAIRAAAPHLLFVGLGAPKQERWMYTSRERLGVPVSVGVGVSFEFVAGMVKRAPRWMQSSGLEWLYRVGMEPGRLWKRYAVTNPRFAGLVIKQALRERRHPLRATPP